MVCIVSRNSWGARSSNSFWISAPDDLLESLWDSPAGQATRELVAQISPTTFFTDSQVAQRNQLGQFLQKGFQQPGAVKAVIATFLLSPPGHFRIVNPESHLPSWLVPAYKNLYETVQVPSTDQSPLASTSVTSPPPAQAESRRDSDLPAPNYGAFPSTLGEFVANRLQLNRLLGLSNLFYIDPEDTEIRDELLQLRRQLSGLILNADESLLEGYFQTDFADRYWSLIRSGIQSLPLVGEDEHLKTLVKDRLNPSMGGGFGIPGSISAFLVAMAYYSPGTMQVGDAGNKLPSWLLSGYQAVFAEALNN